MIGLYSHKHKTKVQVWDLRYSFEEADCKKSGFSPLNFSNIEFLI
jgi:hypothetical protein